MARTVWKYLFDLGIAVRCDGALCFDFPIPAYHRVLCVQAQGRDGAVWVEVDPSAAPIRLQFAVIGTGFTVPDGGEYIGTWQDQHALVWHAYILPATERAVG